MSKYTFEGKERIRIFKPRKSSSLPTIEDKLFFIMVFMKTNPLQEHHAASFGLTQLKANMFIHLFIPLLRTTLKRLGELPARKSSQAKELLKNYDDVFLDGTERPIQRPSDVERAKEHYSGKKTHSLKNNVLTLPNLRIVWISPTYEPEFDEISYL